MRTAFIFAAALLAAPAAHADVLLSNLAEPLRDASPLSDILWGAQSFTNDGNTWDLTNIRAVVGDSSGAPVVLAELREGSTTGTVLTTFALPDFTGPLSARTFTPLSIVTLDPGGTYFFVLGATGGGFDWGYAEGNNFVGDGFFANYEYSEDQAATWTDFGGDNPFFLEVNVSSGAIPEPGTWAMMILGFGLAGAVARRRRALAAA